MIKRLSAEKIIIDGYKKRILTGVLFVLIGGIAFLASFIFDPFSLPFQDWDQLPTEVQNKYIFRSNICKRTRYSGVALAGAGLIIVLSFRRKKL